MEQSLLRLQKKNSNDSNSQVSAVKNKTSYVRKCMMNDDGGGSGLLAVSLPNAVSFLCDANYQNFQVEYLSMYAQRRCLRKLISSWLRGWLARRFRP